MSPAVYVTASSIEILRHPETSAGKISDHHEPSSFSTNRVADRVEWEMLRGTESRALGVPKNSHVELKI